MYNIDTYTGEEMVWHIQLHNPLQVPLELHDLTLAYTFSEGEEVKEAGGTGGGGGGGDGAHGDGREDEAGARAGGEEPWEEGEGNGGGGEGGGGGGMRGGTHANSDH